MNWNQIVLTQKFAKFITDSETNTFNILEGGIRSSKTTTLILGFCRNLERATKDTLNIAFAESISTAKVVLMENNGLGIRPYFSETATELKFKGKDALAVSINGYTHIIVFVGSSKANSFEAIRGMSIYSVIGTEVNLAHETFIAEVIGRTLAEPLRRVFFDLNPTSPNHFIYTQYIDVWVKANKDGSMLGGVNYQTTSLYDNPVFTDEEKQKIASQYDPSSNWYKSLILGMRINPDENVYTLYDYNLAEILPKPDQYIIAVDIGISASATTFVCVGRKDDKLLIYDHYYHRNGKAVEGSHIKQPLDYGKDLIKFINKQKDAFGIMPRYVLIDQDISFYRMLSQLFSEMELAKSMIHYAHKLPISSRIVEMTNLLYTGKLLIRSSLAVVIDAIRNAKYDSNEVDKGKLIRLDDTNLDMNPIDTLDGIEYAITYFNDKGFK